MRRTRQLPLDLSDRRPGKPGGARRGAGRPRKTVDRSPHEARPDISDTIPIHIALRVAPSVGRLRNRTGYAAVRRGLATIVGRADFRVVHASIQSNHIHLLVEAGAKLALSNGVRAFMISCARTLNRLRGRRGAVFHTRYHAVQLRTPRQVRNCLCYILNNWRHHREDLGAAQRRTPIDPYATGLLFDGWTAAPDRTSLPPLYEPLPVAGATTWLVTTGWRKHHPLIDPRTVPGPRAAAEVS